MLFISPNGNGLKWIVSIELTEKINHGQMFQALYNYIKDTYSSEVDKACKDVSRATFLCCDPEAYIRSKHLVQWNKNSIPIYGWLIVNHLILKTGCRKLKKRNQKAQASVNNSNSIHYDVEIVVQRIEEHQLDLTRNYEDWVKLGCAFASEFGEASRNYFHRISHFYPGYDFTETDKQFDKCLKEIIPVSQKRQLHIYFMQQNKPVSMFT